MASLPNMEGIAHWIGYENEKEEIGKKDFSDKLETKPGVLESLARFKKQTVKEYKNEQFKSYRKKELRDLFKKYYPEQAKKDEKTELLDHYNKMSEKMEVGKQDIRDFLKKPDSLK